MANVKAIIAAHLSQRQRAINKQVERAEILDEDRLLCRIIRVAGNIDVPNKPGFVWCQEYSPSNDTNPFHAFNSEVQAREGLDVWIEEGMGGRREVTKWNNATIVNTANYAAQKYLPTHHSDHEWPDFKPGPDVVNVYPRSLSMLRTYPGEGGALTISASSLRYIKGNVLVIFPGKNSLDISAAQPASGLARYVGIYLDPDDNTLKSVNGATTGDSPVITPDNPAFPESAILSANVRLNGDQTTFSEVDMIDVRQILDSSGAIDGTRVSKLVSPDGSVDPAFETDNSGRLSNASEFTYPWEGSTISANLLVKTLDVADYNNLVLKRSTDTSFRGAQVMMLRSKAGDTAVADGITIGILSFSGHDGTDYNEAAEITAVVDGAVSANTVPMALVFDVSADQSTGLKTRLKLAPTVVDIGDVDGTENIDIDFNDEQMFLIGREGALGIGTTSVELIQSGVTKKSQLFLETLATVNFAMTLSRQADAALSSPVYAFARSRSGLTANADGDLTSTTVYLAHDGTDYNAGALLRTVIDGAVSANTVPTAFLFMTTTTNSPTERLRIAPNGLISIGNVPSPLGQLHIDQFDSGAAIPVIVADQADLSEEFIDFRSTIGAGNPIDTAAIGTYYGKIRVAVNGTFKFIPLHNS